MPLRQSIWLRIHAAVATAVMILPMTIQASDCGDEVRALLEQHFVGLTKDHAQSKPHGTQTLLPNEEALIKARADIAWAKAHFNQFIGRFEISENSMNELTPISKADLPQEVASNLFGAQGNVVIVTDKKKLMALKIIKQNKFDTVQSGEYKHDPLVIQKALSDLHAAPQLYGVVPKETLLKWLAKHPSGDDLYGFPPSTRVSYGVLMELLEAPSIKLKRTVTSSGFKSAKDEARAKELNQLVSQLGIDAMDVDYIYNRAGELMLIDFDRYTIRSSKP